MTFEQNPNQDPTKPMKQWPETFDRLDSIPFYRVDQPKKIQGINGPLIFGTDEGFNYKDRNEDRIVINTEKNCFAVIDGMGGYDQGADAAQILAEELQTGFETNLSFKQIQNQAHQRMKDKKLKKNGACYIATRIKGKILEIAQAGDVRLIIIDKNNQIKFETIDEGAGHTVFNVVQGEKPGTTSIHRATIAEGDRIIISSDGITDNIDNDEMAELLVDTTPEQAMQIIAELSQSVMLDYSGKPDNRSVLIYDIKQIEESRPASSEKKEPDFSKVQTFAELFSLLDDQREVVGRTQTFSTNFLKKIINYVRSGVLDITAITSAGGLRNSVVDLIYRYDHFRKTEEQLILQPHSKLEKKCCKAKSFDDLLQTLLISNQSIDGITPAQIGELISQVREGQETIDVLPARTWLRDAVRRLLQVELKEKYFSHK